MIFAGYNTCMLQVNDDSRSIEVRFSQVVGELFRKLNLLNRDQKVCYGITLSQCCAIETLARKGRLTMNELSQYQGVTVSTMTRIVDVLVRDEIVQRINNPADRRTVCIELTPQGQDWAQKLKKCTEDYTGQILRQIAGEKQAQVVESMDLLIRAIEAIDKRCCF